MSRWIVNGIPEGEKGEYSIKMCTETTGHDSWLNYVAYAGIPSGTYTVLFRKFGTSYLNIMQDTAREYDEHSWMIGKMTGDILIAGLGIGMINIPLLDSDATSITIVEKEQDVIDLIWENCAKDERFTLVHADIDTWVPPEGSSWDTGWFDTWLTTNESKDAYKQRMQDKYGSMVTQMSGWNW